MSIAKVSVLDVMAPEVQAVILDLAGTDFKLRFASSNDRAELLDLVSDCDFLLIGPEPLTTELVERCGRVRLIQKWGVGVDKVDLDTARKMGVPVAIAAGSNAAP